MTEDELVNKLDQFILGDMKKAADAIKALRAENKELRIENHYLREREATLKEYNVERRVELEKCGKALKEMRRIIKTILGDDND